jgi:type I restriction-modification system DNA methylase subunit
MSIAHAIGDEKCTIYSQDISQKSSGMLRLNLVLNNLVCSIPNVIQGNTILHPYHRDKSGVMMKFDSLRRVHTPAPWGGIKGMYPESNTFREQPYPRSAAGLVDLGFNHGGQEEEITTEDTEEHGGR